MKTVTKRELFLSILVTFLIAVLIAGYIDSDAVYYKRIVRLNNIDSPADAFAFLKKTTISAAQDSLRPVGKPGIPVRDIIECRRGFWCDEYAIAMGKLLDYSKKKYTYRLVDIYGLDNVPHHTVLQVLEKKRWNTYDLFFRTDTVPPEHTMNAPVLKLGYRTWNYQQKVYHFMIEHNSILKFFILKVRGVY